MSPIQDDVGPLADDLEPPRPPDRGDALSDGVLPYFDPVLLCDLHQADGEGGVLRLVRAQERALEVAVEPLTGLALLFVGVCMGIVEWRSAVYQGETSAACINLTGKKPEEGGRAILMPALVETYGVVALLASILLILWITNPDITIASAVTATP